MEKQQKLTDLYDWEPQNLAFTNTNKAP